MTLFIRAVAADDKAAALKLAISGNSPERFTPELDQFSELPGTPFAYWVGAGVRDTFNRFPTVEGDGRAVRVGLQTSDDFRFVRAVWEIDPNKRGSKWFPFAKGGEMSPFYTSIHLVVNWKDAGREIRNFIDQKTGKLLSRPQNTEFYFKGGLTWPLRASKFAPQPLPEGCIFSVRGYSVFLPPQQLMAGLAIFNSKTFDYLFKALLGRFGYPEFVVGILQKLPWPEPGFKESVELAALSRTAWSIKRALDAMSETSLAFVLPEVLNNGKNNALSALSAMESIQRHVDEISLKAFGLDEQSDAEIAGSSVFLAAEISDETSDDDDQAETQVGDGGESGLMSWALGVVMGRFDIRLATGERPIPHDPEPFDPLPVTSPGMVPDGNPGFVPFDGVLVDDPGHADDLIAHVIAVYERLNRSPPEADVLRQILAHEFFPSHVKTYSKSGRKAPIYWQLSTPSTGYSVWLYAHALTKDVLFRVQADFVAPKLAHEERQIASLIESAGANPSAKERKQIAAQEAFVDEIRSFSEEIKRVAPLWNPSLDDGIILTMAPLWRMVPQHKPWQKELKNKWDELAAGKYDWAHVAMHLWPERVVPKCAIDCSLAIAHGLLNVFWAEDGNGKLKPRQNPARPIDQIVNERTSIAVKAALKELMDASAPNGAKTKARKSSS
jgi:hypothetical protein